jgi:four helix bundle protein
MKINSYKDLEAYKKAYEVAKMVYRMTATFPKEELYALSNQLRRAAVSVPSNIAEGYMRGSKEYVQYLKIALGSAAELETQLSLSRDLGFCDGNNFKDVYALNEEVIRLLKTCIKRIGHSV